MFGSLRVHARHSIRLEAAARDMQSAVDEARRKTVVREPHAREVLPAAGS